MDAENKIRVFICIEFPGEVIKEIARIQNLISSKKLFIGKMTELDNLHVTLKFLGGVKESKLKLIKDKLSLIKFDEMNLSLGEIGTFNFKGNPRILWVKVRGRDIINLQKKIDDVLKEEFVIEKRFMSHLTIARIKFVKDKKYFFDYLKNVKCKKIKFKVKEFKIKQSVLKKLSPEYLDLKIYNTE